VSFSTIALCVASQRVIPKVSVYFVIDLVRKLLDTLSYVTFITVLCVHHVPYIRRQPKEIVRGGRGTK
jgi:hypothetical protein